MTDLARLRQAAARADDGAAVLIPIARQMLAVQETDDAIQVLRRFVKAHPRDIGSLTFLCRILTQQERFSEARDLAREFESDAAVEISDLRTLATLYRSCQDFTRWEIIVKQIVARPDRTIEDHVQLVELLANRPRPLREANAELARFLSHWRDDPKFWQTAARLQHLIAYKLTIRGRPYRMTVIQSAERALKLHPDDYNFRAWYAVALSMSQRPIRFLWQMRQLENLIGSDINAHIIFCELAVRLGRTRQFRRVAARTVTLPTTDGAKLLRLARVLWKGGMAAETFATLARIDLAQIKELSFLAQISEFSSLCGADDIGLAAIARMRALRPDSATALSLETNLQSTSQDIKAIIADGTDPP